jgi:hypothetical protein
MAGLDPTIHRLPDVFMVMDARIKSGHVERVPSPVVEMKEAAATRSRVPAASDDGSLTSCCS